MRNTQDADAGWGPGGVGTYGQSGKTPPVAASGRPRRCRDLGGGVHLLTFDPSGVSEDPPDRRLLPPARWRLVGLSSAPWLCRTRPSLPPLRFYFLSPLSSSHFYTETLK